MARVAMNGRQIACNMFPAGKKHGPEWRAAKEWEEEQKKLAWKGMTISTALELLWRGEIIILPMFNES